MRLEDMPDIGLTRELLDRIHGIALLTELDIYHLFRFAREIPEGGTYLELGVYNGGAVVCAAEASRATERNITLIAVDMGFGSGFYDNTGGFPVRAMEGKIDDRGIVSAIDDTSVDLIFNDADQRYDALCRDIAVYWDKLKPGAVLLGHDYLTAPDFGFMDTKRVVDDVFGKLATVMEGHTTMWMVRKDEETDAAVKELREKIKGEDERAE